MEIIIILGVIAWVACSIAMTKETVDPSEDNNSPSIWDNIVYYSLIFMFIVVAIMLVTFLGPLIFILIFVVWLLKKLFGE